ncbi:MAG: 4Fe-4S binding protein [Myxococcota bacterium]
MRLQAQEGLMRTYRQPWRRRGLSAWILCAALVAFYCVLYWTDALDPVAHALHLKDKWFVYGALYSLVMIGGAGWYLWHHGNARYNQLRIATNVGVQVVLGFSVPYVMALLGHKDFYFSYLWPLKYDYLYPSTFHQIGPYLAAYAVIAAFVVAPVASILFGKRWYCSWVCGCGALANTFGDPWRHLTASSTRSWRFEKVAIHTVLAFALVTTGLVIAGEILDYKAHDFNVAAQSVKGWYGLVVALILAGVIGTGLYPVAGPRVWCRNFCPMAALLGITQKAGRFRIRVKRDMCISCGNCTTYCEMGIDVRSYAQANESFTRAACVGCGMCAHVCPRGVLRLENAWATADDKRRQGLETIDF